MTDLSNARSQLQSVLNDLPEAELQQWLKALQSNSTQINLGNAKGYQVKVTGGTAYIGDLHIGAEVLKTVLRDLLQDRRSAEPTGIPQNLPRSGAIKFVGRDEDLNRLHVELQQTDRLAITAVQGMGGIGKTELALQYAQAHYQQGLYPGGVCWLQARDLDIGSQITRFAILQLGLSIPDGLELADQVAFCWRRWRDGDVLIVLDDVTDYEKIAPYLPPAESRFKVLMTTRLQLGRSVKPVAIEVLEESAALDLLKSLTGVERIEAQLAAAQHLCHWLGYLPLGLELVGRYLAAKPDLPLTTLQRRLEQQLTLVKREVGMTASHEHIAAAFELSWQELNEPARQLCYLLSVFALAPIPWSLVESCWPDGESEALEDIRDQALLQRSLVQRTGENRYQLHQLLREFFGAKRPAADPTADWPQRYCQQMVQIAQKVPHSPTLADILRLSPTISHLTEAATTWLTAVADADLACSFIGITRFYEGQGAYAQAEPWSEQCLVACRDRLGEAHPAVARSLNNLGGLYYDQGRYGEAEPLLQQALALRQRLLGEAHPHVAHSLNNLAMLYINQGRYGEAEPLLQQALAMRQRLLDEAHPDVARSLNSLASLYDHQGRYGEAEPLYVWALAMRQRLLGEAHPDVADSLNNLAMLYDHQGRYGEAESLLQQALALRQRLLGDAHPDVAHSLNNLAMLYDHQGRYGEAEPLLQQALALRQRLLGEVHPAVATSLNNLAILYDHQGRYGEAEPLLQQALALRQRLLGDAHPDVARSLNSLASLYDHQGRYGEAEPLYVRALDIADRQLGPTHPSTVTCRNNLNILRDLIAQKSSQPGDGDRPHPTTDDAS
jgi:tetratricopeptide (TPR) repeat protein